MESCLLDKTFSGKKGILDSEIFKWLDIYTFLMIFWKTQTKRQTFDRRIERSSKEHFDLQEKEVYNEFLHIIVVWAQ